PVTYNTLWERRRGAETSHHHARRQPLPDLRGRLRAAGRRAFRPRGKASAGARGRYRSSANPRNHFRRDRQNFHRKSQGRNLPRTETRGMAPQLCAARGREAAQKQNLFKKNWARQTPTTAFFAHLRIFVAFSGVLLQPPPAVPDLCRRRVGL